SEDKIAIGQRFVTKLWNVANFTYPFLKDYEMPGSAPPLLPADKWVLSRLQSLVVEASDSFKSYDHAAAKSMVEVYFWDVIADNYIEMVKNRLYVPGEDTPEKQSAKYALYLVLLTILKLLAPIMPHITEEVFQLLFKKRHEEISLHLMGWPDTQPELIDSGAEASGQAMVAIATEARRYKSENKLSIATPLNQIKITSAQSELVKELLASITDIQSVTRAKNVVVVQGMSDSPSPESSLGVAVQVE
ncbi:MAG: class I tRNA ligase family protein, partial [Dehalococcoidales bacterium]|nr:class I tRNA ligase family protein [Dehalococcoidales bacterium]